MADVTTFFSRFRIIFTPAGGEEMTLLDLDDESAAEPKLTGEHPVETSPVLGGLWSSSRAVGGVSVKLAFDKYYELSTMWEAQAFGYERWLQILRNPAGVLRFQTAFDDEDVPHIDWVCTAVAGEPSVEELNADTSPFPHARGTHISYTFTLGEPQTYSETTDETTDDGEEADHA